MEGLDMEIENGKLEFATLGGGCFWCLEAVFEQMLGVDSVVSGYCGGHVLNPTYRQICEGNTGHAEVVRIGFDPLRISYEQVLSVFFGIHDPTTLNQQGNDHGTQYRSVVFYHSSEQFEMATALFADLASANIWSAPMTTQLLDAPLFYPAEAYHQHYFLNNPDQPYCQFVVSPKLNKFRKQFSDHLKPA
jgi:peptide-methionine (S)-S-oxide reductase